MGLVGYLIKYSLHRAKFAAELIVPLERIDMSEAPERGGAVAADQHGRGKILVWDAPVRVFHWLGRTGKTEKIGR